MDLLTAKAIIHDLNESQLRDLMMHIIISVKFERLTWSFFEDLLDKTMAAARKVA